MNMKIPNRRSFLKNAALGSAAITLGDLGILNSLPSVSAAEAAAKPDIVRLRQEIEPIVRLIEDTPRDRLIEEIASAIRAGKLRYQEVLAALLLAGVRNVQPRPSVGFKFHAVLVVNSAHLASLASPDNERWLPIFWALDEFKSSQARDVKEGNWTMAAVDETKIPPAHKARAAFINAMDNWDVEAADTAAASLARNASAGEAFELFARYGARDFRSIGHKAIFVANSFRTLQHIGWHHAEPVLRSLAYALLNHNGQANPAKSDHEADRPWRDNEKLAKELPNSWHGGRIDKHATTDLLQVLRDGSASDASQKVANLVARGVSPQSVYDAVLLGGAELLMRQPGIVALHSMTSTNALHYIFATSADDRIRRRILLQNAAFLPMFREAMKGRGDVAENRIDQLAPSEGTVENVLDNIGKDRASAASVLLGQLDSGADPKQFTDAARRLVFLKGNNSHDYKFGAAVLEDFRHLSPDWRNRYLAASTYQLRGNSAKDNALVERSRAALG
jgi:hypothetical protein